jgi:hypothetical protein
MTPRRRVLRLTTGVLVALGALPTQTEVPPFEGAAISLGSGATISKEWRIGADLDQYFQIGITEREDKRSFVASVAGSYSVSAAPNVELKAGAGRAWHWESNPEVSATGAVAQIGALYRLRRCGMSPTAVARYFHPLGGRREASAREAAGPFEASLLTLGIGLDWKPSGRNTPCTQPTRGLTHSRISRLGVPIGRVKTGR